MRNGQNKQRMRNRNNNNNNNNNNNYNNNYNSNNNSNNATSQYYPQSEFADLEKQQTQLNLDLELARTELQKVRDGAAGKTTLSTG